MTFRLADSLPAAVLRRIVAERRKALEKLHRCGQPDTLSETKRLRRSFSQRIEAYLDGGRGCCCLANPPVAEMIAGALRHFDGVRYELHAWCVMPNHVHVVFRPFPDHSLASIVHSWKSFTALRANLTLGRGGNFWQREYYDHLIRNTEQLARAVRYIAENPVRAGLKGWKWVEVFPAD